MDTLRSAMDDAAAECSLAVPSLFATNTTTNYVQLKRYMVATAKELIERIDWAAITLDGIVTGDGTASYPLADDFFRLTRSDDEASPAVWSDSMRRGFRPVTSNGQWTVLQANGPTLQYGYRIVGASIQFTQNIAVGQTIKYSYLSKNWILAGTVPAATWGDDGDFTLLPSKLIELGVEWRWNRKRGLEYASYQGEFEMELSRLANDDRGIRKIGFGQRASGGSPYRNMPVPTLGPDPNA
jgi:hypothetical protein